jgi:hypothetical protein
VPAAVERPSSLDTAQRSGDILLFLAFFGGDTRAAAFSCGVLEGLRDARIRRAEC